MRSFCSRRTQLLIPVLLFSLFCLSDHVHAFPPLSVGGLLALASFVSVSHIDRYFCLSPPAPFFDPCPCLQILPVCYRRCS